METLCGLDDWAGGRVGGAVGWASGRGSRVGGQDLWTVGGWADGGIGE